MASGVNAHDSCKGTALEIPIQVRVQALSLAVVTFNTGKRTFSDWLGEGSVRLHASAGHEVFGEWVKALCSCACAGRAQGAI